MYTTFAMSVFVLRRGPAWERERGRRGREGGRGKREREREREEGWRGE